MIEARRTEEPGGGSEGVTASNNLIVCLVIVELTSLSPKSEA